MNEILLGSCEETLSNEGMVANLVLTDPPYVENQWEVAYSLLGRVAPHVLKPSGFLIAYTPHLHLPKILNLLSEGLEWYWIFAQINNGLTATVWPRNLTAEFKPLLILQKPPIKKCPLFVGDVVDNGKMEKGYHEWEQSIQEALYLIEHFSEEGDVIYDPFSGSGTSLLAAKLLGRRYFGHELNPNTWAVATRRLTQTPISNEFLATRRKRKEKVQEKTKQKKLKEW